MKIETKHWSDPRDRGRTVDLAGFVSAAGRWPELAKVLAGEIDLSLDGLRASSAEGSIQSDILADAIAALHGLPRIDLAEMLTMKNLSGTVSARYLRANGAVPLEGSDGLVVVAVVDPAIGNIRQGLTLALHRPVSLAVAPIDAVDAMLLRSGEANELGAGAWTPPANGEDDARDQDIRDLAEGAPVVRALDDLFDLAAALRATDIHIEPAPGRLVVRFRIDGILRAAVAPPPHGMVRALVSRVKILAGLDIAEHRLPQDGRFRAQVSGAAIDVRVAIMPSTYGEAAVLRLLARENTLVDLPRLGLSPADRETLVRHACSPFGLVVATGPTGSGKTTTLAALLTQLANGTRKIVTVEDPIEYQIPTVVQTQVQPAIGLTFARALRAFLRQDPDVIMVGEIRDSETAEIAVQAALTGHLVLSSLHTNTAAAAIARLLDMGVESYLLAATLRCIVGQRLVRRLCERCRKLDEPDTRSPEEAAFLVTFRVDASERFYRPVGCPNCNGIGYKGRVGVFEVLTVGDDARRAIVPGVSTDAVERAGRAGGMKTMLEDGLDHCRAGETSIEEVVRVSASI